MEQAIFISKINNLKYVNGDFSRLYFGIEFCQNLIPSIEDVTVILKFIFERKIELTFVTPYLTNKGMGKIKPLLNYLIDKKSETEIVVNDWGLLKWIAYEHPESNLILGRLLNKQKRGPRILNLDGKVSESMVSHFQMSNIDSSIFSGFLKNKNIKRVE
ncbi:MAG: hypothetical protein KAJ14_16735, partial [Candidatus Omnitrophica bacterium]|nr:hypothetical protein [Candidatus Omnitrophota bacterium]